MTPLANKSGNNPVPEPRYSEPERTVKSALDIGTLVRPVLAFTSRAPRIHHSDSPHAVDPTEHDHRVRVAAYASITSPGPQVPRVSTDCDVTGDQHGPLVDRQLLRHVHQLLQDAANPGPSLDHRGVWCDYTPLAREERRCRAGVSGAEGDAEALHDFVRGFISHRRSGELPRFEPAVGEAERQHFQIRLIRVLGQFVDDVLSTGLVARLQLLSGHRK